MTGGIVVLTGAGISKESGLATFRDIGGLWATVRIEDMATPDAFRRNPARVQAFYNARRVQLQDLAVQPNAARQALVRLAREHPGPVLVVTQNVDDLHDRAGQPTLLHMHGELAKARCLHCTAVSPFSGAGLADVRCPACEAQALRPHVVWFGETPLHMRAILQTLQEPCRLFAAIGTSSQVYSAAGFAELASECGAHGGAEPGTDGAIAVLPPGPPRHGDGSGSGLGGGGAGGSAARRALSGTPASGRSAPALAPFTARTTNL